MSSTLWMINWTVNEVTPTLNGKALSPVRPAEKSANYFPFVTSVPRDTSNSGQSGIWGDLNTLQVKSSGSIQTLIYNNLADPEGAAPNTDLLLWIWPDFLVFSQIDDQLGNPVKPSG